MQNKPNLHKDKTNATLFSANDYENNPPGGLEKTNPIKANSLPRNCGPLLLLKNMRKKAKNA
jgi:hypothetical protein